MVKAKGRFVLYWFQRMLEPIVDIIDSFDPLAVPDMKPGGGAIGSCKILAQNGLCGMVNCKYLDSRAIFSACCGHTSHQMSPWQGARSFGNS